MNAATSVKELRAGLSGAVSLSGDVVTVLDEPALRQKIDGVVYSAVFGEGLVRETARWLLWELGQSLGIRPASIHELYMAVGRGDLPGNFTVPAMNVRAMNFNTSRAIFRAAGNLDVGAMIFEIARSEMGYTDQRPAEYIACLLGAAIKEGFRGPLFVQGDHFQISAARFAADRDAEVESVKALIDEAIEAGFYNIDIDTSTLVDLSYPTLDEQQRQNYLVCAELTRHARSREPQGVTISLGGEIGEVGHKNSTVEELHAFMDGYLAALDGACAGISKISVQTGTSHGGVVLPDGTLAQVSVDFETLRALSRAARDVYHTGGAVQHGASTLPREAFGNFPEVGTLEIHLATNFQNIIYDHAPQHFVDTAYNYILSNLKNEWKAGKTEEQFLYATRKKALGPFKKVMWDLGEEVQQEMGQVLQQEFEFLFRQLHVFNTRRMVARWVTPLESHRPRPSEGLEEEALDIAADLAD